MECRSNNKQNAIVASKFGYGINMAGRKILQDLLMPIDILVDLLEISYPSDNVGQYEYK